MDPTPNLRRSMVFAVLAVGATTLAAFAVHRVLQLADVVVLYMFCITAVATRFERRASLLAALLSVACLDFFFILPTYTFSVADMRFIGTFGMMLGVAWVVGNLAERIRTQAREAEDRERHTAALLRLGGILADGGDACVVRDQVETFLEHELGFQVRVLLPDAEGNLAPSPVLTRDELGVAQWALEARESAGAGTATLPGSRGLFLPLGGPRHPLGVLALFPPLPRLVSTGRPLWEAMAAQITLALERARLTAERSEARIKAEQEHLRSLLLSSISHDLRTPLGTIAGASSTLLDPGPGTTSEDRRELLASIHQEAGRLGRLVDNLLDITRLESGEVKVRKEWVPLEEVVGAALNRLEAQIGDRPVKLRLGEVWVPLDPVLMEQVLLNLLDNAIKFSPPETPLEIVCRAEEGRAVLVFTDRGPGFAPGEEEKVFEKLYRGSRASWAPGAGLGLAICRGIILAHGGTIRAESAPGGGARVIITLPVEGRPDLPSEA